QRNDVLGAPAEGEVVRRSAGSPVAARVGEDHAMSLGEGVEIEDVLEVRPGPRQPMEQQQRLTGPTLLNVNLAPLDIDRSRRCRHIHLHRATAYRSEPALVIF